MTSLLSRAVPVLGFLAAATVLARLADAAAVFEVAGGWCARAARGRRLRLWLLVAVLATATTVLLSLDTAVVLLTPVVLAVCTQAGLPPLPYAFLVAWLANTASLLLPVSNLTTLLAVGRLHTSAAAYAGRTWLAEVVSVSGTLLWLGLLHRRDLRGGYAVPERAPVPDRVLFRAGAVACIALGPAVLLGAPPWAAATACALLLVVACAVRGRRDLLRPKLLPVGVLAVVAALFAVVDGLTHAGLASWLRPLVGTNDLQVAIVAAGASNVVNNLPAYVALEPATGSAQLLALLAGTNVGPLLVFTGSVATLLWRDACRRRGVTVSAGRFFLTGLGMLPLLALTVLALRATG